MEDINCGSETLETAEARGGASAVLVVFLGISVSDFDLDLISAEEPRSQWHVVARDTR